MKKTSNYGSLHSGRGKASAFALDYSCVVSVRKANAKSKSNRGTSISHRSCSGKVR